MKPSLSKTFISCFVCDEEMELHVIEWPPAGTVCNNCGSVYRYDGNTPNKEPIFLLQPEPSEEL